MLLPVPEAVVPRTRNRPLCDISPGAEGAAGTAAAAVLAHGGLTLAADTSHGQRCCCSGSSSCWPRAGLCRACGTPASKRPWALGGSLGNISGVSFLERAHLSSVVRPQLLEPCGEASVPCGQAHTPWPSLACCPCTPCGELLLELQQQAMEQDGNDFLLAEGAVGSGP